MSIPQNFEGWKICIEKKCGIPLRPEFARKRLTVYEDEDLPETQRFIKMYGRDHLAHIKQWFQQAIVEQEIRENL